MDDARMAVETGVDGVDVVIGTSSYLREHSHGKDVSKNNSSFPMARFGV
jgi:homocitrate synthase